MPTQISPVIVKWNVEQDGGDQVVDLQLRYSGTEDLSDKFVADELLDIEIPSHAPPPAPKPHGPKK